MNKLKELLESAVLNEDTKEALQEAFNTAVEAEVVSLRESYQEEYNAKREELFALLPQMIEEATTEELEAISQELKEAHTVELRYATKLQEFKESHAQATRELVDVLVAESVAEEVEELKEDIELAKKYQFSMSIYEAFASAYEQIRGETDLNIHDELAKAKTQLESYQRKEKMDELLEGVGQGKREVLEIILESVPVHRMEEKFNSVRDLVLAESVSEDGKETLTESDTSTPEGNIVLESQDTETAETVKDEAYERSQRALRYSLRLAQNR